MDLHVHWKNCSPSGESGVDIESGAIDGSGVEEQEKRAGAIYNDQAGSVFCAATARRTRLAAGRSFSPHFKKARRTDEEPRGQWRSRSSKSGINERAPTRSTARAS